MIEIFCSWIAKYSVDGFRIDTAQHVNPEFWQKFVPAMLSCARKKGIPVTTITETLTPASATFQAWQSHQLQALQAALATATGR